MTDHPVTATRLKQVLAEHPQLSDFGFGRPNFKCDDFDMAEQRRSLRSRLGQVRAAHDYLTGLRRTTADDDLPTSYGLKHEAEHEIGYTTNGAFIAAAIIAGVPMKKRPGSPNPLLGVTTRPPRPHAQPGSFTAWLRQRREDDNPIGDLARDMWDDLDFPTGGDFTVYRDYLWKVGASGLAVDTLVDAWEAYSGTRPNPYDDED